MRYPTETRADLQRYYNLNIDGMGTDFTPAHAAACLACLPVGCALFARENPRYAVTLSQVPVAAIADALKGDSKNTTDGIEFGSMPVEELEAFMGRTFIDTDG